MKSEDTQIATEEYASLRHELYKIIEARYLILTTSVLAVAAVAAITADNIEKPAVVEWVPLVFFTILIPATIVNHYLTLHFMRLAAYLYVRFEQQRSDFIFERALSALRKQDKSYTAYTWPILLTYLVLIVLADFISLFTLPWSVLWRQPCNASNGWLQLFFALWLIGPLGMIYGTKRARASREEEFRVAWEQAIRASSPRQVEPSDAFRRRAVFVDRDGVINVNRDDDVKRLEEFAFIPRAVEALVDLSKAGLQTIVISNQPTIAERKTTLREVEEIHRLLVDAVKSAGGNVKAVYYCPHAPDEGCECRKPKPGLLLQAAKDNGLDLAKSFLVGDQITDIEAGKRVGCRTILVRTGLGERWLSKKNEWPVAPDRIVSDLYEAVGAVLLTVDAEAEEKEAGNAREVH